MDEKTVSLIDGIVAGVLLGTGVRSLVFSGMEFQKLFAGTGLIVLGVLYLRWRCPGFLSGWVKYLK